MAMSLHKALMPPARANPLVVAWRWRYELIGLAALVLLAMALQQAGAVGAVVMAGAAVAALELLARWPAGRRWAIARAWCVVTPHRVRTACVRARIHSTRGRLPAVLGCSPRQYGEAVLLWLPAGVTAGDLHADRQLIAAACYAYDVRVMPNSRYRHIVTLKVIRHPKRPARQPAGPDNVDI